MLADLKRPSPRWRYILVAWSLYGVYMAVQSYVIRERLGNPVTWAQAFAGDLSYSLLWIPLTPFVLWLAIVFPFDKGKIFRNISIHLGLSFGFGIAHKAMHNLAVALFRIAMEGGDFAWDLQYRQLIAYFDYGMQLYWIILLLKFGYEYHARFKEKELQTSKLETRLAMAQLQSLKMQIQPHFLFNTLNAISVLIQENQVEAQKMVSRLSGLLRRSLENADAHVVPLSSELEFLDTYLEIQKARFGDRLSVISRIDPDIKDAEVPYLILQPIVENALQHGISARPGPGLITIEASRQNGYLRLSVTDSGSGAMDPAKSQVGSGIGLSNTRERLKQYYGDDHQFHLNLKNGTGSEAVIVIPFRNASPGITT